MRGVVAALLVLALLAGCASNPASTTTTVDTVATAPLPTDPDRDRPNDAEFAATGRWLAPFEGEVPAVNLVLLRNGRVLYWSGVEAAPGDGPTDLVFFTAAPRNASSRVLDMSESSPKILTPVNPDGAGSDLFCAGQTVLADGRVLAVGSSVWSTDPTQEFFLHGGTDARIYDPVTNTWERKADMALGRWYPSLITLPDGRALVASGIGSLSNPTQQWPQMEVYDVANDTWTGLPGADRLLPLYPRLTVVPHDDGAAHDEVFYNTMGTLWGPFGEHPLQATWSIQAGLDLDAPTWSEEGPSLFGARQHGSTVMLRLEEGRAPEFVSFGGTLYQSILATPFTERISLATDPPTNTLAAPMASPRWHHNGVLLPTGEILAVGGGLYDNVVAHGQQNVPVMEAALYDPGADTWTTLSAMQVPRMYHSTALLLPDGRVLAGGHVPLPNPSVIARDTVNPQVNETRLEIFEPPYLFRGPRPVILEAPAEVGYGANLTFRVDDASRIREVVLMRPGATTHAFDADQRAVLLPFTVEGNTIVARAPPDGFVAPPGYYMLFALGEGEGGLVPAVAPFVHLV